MRVFHTIMAAGLVVGLVSSGRAELANGVKAIVGGTVITYQQVEDNATKAIELLQREYGAQPDVYQKKLMDTLGDALEDLVQRQLILTEFSTAGYKIPDSVIDNEVEHRIRDRYGDRATLTKSLLAEHMTFESFREQVREEIIVEAMRQKYVSDSVIISPLRIQQYYNAHKDDYKVEDEIHLRMIVLDSTAAATQEQRKKMAQEIIGKIDEGASFSEMAAIYSTGSQRNQGGDWGWVERSVLRKELADPAFSLPIGKHSGVIETPDAAYIMLVEETHPAHTRALAEVRDDIEKTLGSEQRAKVQKDWIDGLKKKTFVRYF